MNINDYIRDPKSNKNLYKIFNQFRTSLQTGSK